MSRKSQIHEVFDRAVEIDHEAQRRDYVDVACAEDAQLRQEVKELLAAYDQSAGFLADHPVVGDSNAGLESVGTTIGPYKLREQIGSGGMGDVYVAEQLSPVKRKVALKIIKPGMDTKQVIARFEAERQALAMMDHPNIARVLDAGNTESGRPYFVMDLVRGLPVTEYCDKQKLSTRERLELFVTVCQAVQHAHQKGIIHRDIKPTNVLVTRNGDRAVPKVIDFGVAKATNQRLTERTIYTQFNQMIGTPLYMSPEQAELSELDVDTRSDVYSLGVVLYELLTGNTPFDKEKLSAAGFEELRRIIRDEDPVTPSSRISTLQAQNLSTISAQRSCAPHQLNSLVGGELDWITMKALEKNPARRYESASALAADVGRHLDNEPVAACPPTLRYRFGKFARRNKAAMITAGMVLIALLLGIVGTSWQAWRANREAQNAEAARRAEVVLRQQAEQKAAETDAVVSFLVNDLLGATPKDSSVDEGLVGEDVIASAEKKLETAFADQPLVEAAIHDALGSTFNNRHQYAAAQGHVARATELRTKHLGRDDPSTLQSMSRLARTLRGLVKLAEAETLQKEILQRQRRVFGLDHRQTSQTLDNLAELFHEQERFSEAQKLHEAALRIRSRVLGPVHEETLDSIGEVGNLLEKQGKLEEAEHLYEETLAKQRAAVVLEQPRNLSATNSLVRLLRRQGKLDDAQRVEQETLDYLNRYISLHASKGSTFQAYFDRANLHARLGAHAQAVEDNSKAIELQPNYSPALINRGNSLMALNRWDEAMASWERAAEHDAHNEKGCRAKAENQLAWELSTHSDKQRREPGRAVQYAQSAVRLRPSNAGIWNTLGVAHYRAGHWEAAIEALTKSMELSTSDDSAYDTLFLSMAHWQLDHKDEARKWYGLATKSMEEHKSDDEQLRQFRAEADQLLGSVEDEN